MIDVLTRFGAASNEWCIQVLLAFIASGMWRGAEASRTWVHGQLQVHPRLTCAGSIVHASSFQYAWRLASGVSLSGKCTNLWALRAFQL